METMAYAMKHLHPIEPRLPDMMYASEGGGGGHGKADVVREVS